MRRVGQIYVASSAVIVGDVTFGEDCNLWPHCVIRADVAPIRLGARVNVQDGALLHCNYAVPLEIADDVAVAHHAVVHGRQVGRRTLIGTAAVVLDDSVIGEDCLIAAGALVTPGSVVPDGSVVMGVPGRVVRPIRDDEREYIRYVVAGCLELARRHVAGEFQPLPAEPWSAS